MDSKPPVLQMFAVSAPGLEPYTALELRQLDLLPDESGNELTSTWQAPGTEDDLSGGVAFEGNLRTLYLANLWLRSANRVLLRLGDFHAAAFSELRKKASRLPWEHYLTPGRAVSLRVTCHKSRLYHSDAVAERVAGAIGDRLGKPVRVVKFDEQAEQPKSQLILVRLVHDRCTISIDSSGALLHRRGYRLAIAKAPLRETLAAGLLMASGWQPASPLLDPFCGSGTIPIEAALLALKKAPGLATLRLPAVLKSAGNDDGLIAEAQEIPLPARRRFAFMDWPDYDANGWEILKLDATRQHQEQVQKLAGKLLIQASDRDEGAVSMAHANAARAGVADWIDFRCQAFSAIQPTAETSGWLVTNPPYGVRLHSSKDLRNLYAQLGNVLHEKCTGWQVAILCSELTLLTQTGLKLDSSLTLVNGGVRVRLGRGGI